jgi:tRNA(His) 5'-end guanylyltransferase
VVLRLDGRGFTTFTARAGFDKPFDPRFQDLVRQIAEALLIRRIHVWDDGEQSVGGMIHPF